MSQNRDSNSVATPWDIVSAQEGEKLEALHSISTPDAAVQTPIRRSAHKLPPSYPPLQSLRAQTPQTEVAHREPPRRRRRHISTLLIVFLILLITALFKTFILQWYEIPSSSMEDTLRIGDRVAVTMYDSTEISRGDVVVFKDPDHWLNVTDPSGVKGFVQDALIFIRLLPEDSGHHLIKRVIGVAGDHIVADGNGSMSVNGVTLNETYLKPGVASSEIAFDVTVPQGYVWVMGDNRSNSADSRYHQDDAHGGFVPVENVVGVAKAVVWPINHWGGLDSAAAVFADVPDVETSSSRTEP